MGESVDERRICLRVAGDEPPDRWVLVVGEPSQLRRWEVRQGQQPTAVASAVLAEHPQ